MDINIKNLIATLRKEINAGKKVQLVGKSLVISDNYNQAVLSANESSWSINTIINGIRIDLNGNKRKDVNDVNDFITEMTKDLDRTDELEGVE